MPSENCLEIGLNGSELRIMAICAVVVYL